MINDERLQFEAAQRKKWDASCDHGQDWVRTSTRNPNEGQLVWVMDSGGCVQQLIFSKSLWWFPDRSMYVYFEPMFWRAA